MIVQAAEAFQFDTIDDVVSDVARGHIVIVTDDADRENEGDLVMAAEKATPEAVNFMAKHGRGLICVPISNERAEQLGLQRMVVQNREMYRTDFTVSVDAARGITTGISAQDRAATIQAIANPKSSPDDLVQPGHVFPLRAKDGGVLRRTGHTEAAVDLARMAGLQPAGVLCEILHDDGTMARLPELMEFRTRHGLRICTIQNLIAHRRLREKLVEREQVVKLPTEYGDFDLHLYRSKLDGAHHLALVKGKIDKKRPTLVRVHSECLTGDVFGSRRCDCGNQLHAALRQIQEEGNGVLVYMRQEGRGIGLAAKIHAYKLQEEGLDTVEANAKLGYPSDLRDYGLGAQILFDLGVRQFRFLTNNPKKVVGLEGYGLEMVEQVPIRSEANPHNAKYLETKKVKLGHML
ncbi:MAG: bifunctional 3,4-dihydroxy-2-butanone-4-phosphate synthase/GTP cyclohydrolase II [Verrucomicrobia bacterium]|nr:MAG: bifunctional 3,4-dihydroxy-2-butanone-4-phosphate synthase/GTP cyclohydrolase II [Verrucomicrobiota bacterium]PYL58868.1 MAG: bifunctional 3,4-dihydroxy-2-butanone-4-phosphate synthase/GTP cyclohydrolase II [Verrucomicrobiota bacterium]